MRKHNAMMVLSVKSLALLFASLLTVSSTLADSQKFVIEKYLGKFDDLKSKGYTDENGISLNVSRKPSAVVYAICQSLSKTAYFDCVLVMAEILGHDASGYAIQATPSEMIHIQLPQGWRYFDTADADCRSSKYPDAEIIAIGKWTVRKKPLHGGYARSLKKAWRIDYQLLRFVEIPTRDVSCGFDDEE